MKPHDQAVALSGGAAAPPGLRVCAEQAVLIAQTVQRLSGDVTLSRAVAVQLDLVGHAQALSYAELQGVSACVGGGRP